FSRRLLVLLCYKKGAPQKGQPESCRSRIRAMVCRSVAMDQGLCRSARTGRTPRVESRRHFGDGYVHSSGFVFIFVGATCASVADAKLTTGSAISSRAIER